MSRDDKKWEVFDVVGEKGLFSIEKQPRKLTERDLSMHAAIPVYSSQSTNNGIMGFTGENADFLVKEKPVLIFGDHTRSMNIAQYSFCAADNVKILTQANMESDELLYVTCVWKKRIPDMGYARHWRKAKVVGIELPIVSAGKPDYNYMAEYICEKRKTMLTNYRTYIEAKVAEAGNVIDIPPLSEKVWHPIPITDIFDSFVPGKGKGLNHLIKTEADGINYIGATNRNNGVICCVMNDDVAKRMLMPGNCIGFIKNGDGSAGFAIYKAESFVSTSDVIYGYADWLNRYTGLFFVAAQDMIERKYSHGHKRNREHLEGDKVMLPITNAGTPDYAYMEQYAKNMILKKYKQYLTYLDAKGKQKPEG